jgi:iron complex transport system substrate-binding protein
VTSITPSNPPTPPTPRTRDDTDARPSAQHPRVVSLLPSATEIVCALDGRAQLVGRSHECEWPPTDPSGLALDQVPVLTGARTHFDVSQPGASLAIDQQVRAMMDAQQALYTLDEARLEALRPDVVITQDLCKVCSIDLASVQRVVADIARRTGSAPTLLALNPETVEGVLDDVLRVGDAIGRAPEATALLTRLRERMYTLADYANPFSDGTSVAFLEWCDPLFVGGHWTPQLIERAGCTHPLNPTRAIANAGAAAGPIGQSQRAAGKSVTLPASVLVASRPEHLIVCPCGLTLDQTRAEVAKLARTDWWPRVEAVRRGRVALVDGNQHFNRPGPRLIEAYAWLVGWLNDRPDVIPEGFAWEAWRG